MRARRPRAQNRSLCGINEDSSTKLTQPLTEKDNFRRCLKVFLLLEIGLGLLSLIRPKASSKIRV